MSALAGALESESSTEEMSRKRVRKDVISSMELYGPMTDSERDAQMALWPSNYVVPGHGISRMMVAMELRYKKVGNTRNLVETLDIKAKRRNNLEERNSGKFKDALIA
ncbi:hypothetical protein BC939DRAFT_507463 [Gamsiella multidivaricata]|uniref:uncharacterized protein n=1 Tax=Gamsiella multidivaricata TaxID=101098 RepID=UPI0022205CA6|nr:uncharacterized protein BC939DRAFT_507463 [Gamsiella multidivaricata]KAI7817352.1 hypothetical protein BC939DRAFT_507463 [Gamsiella multidivaricata]